jgi:hypothetical protein
MFALIVVASALLWSVCVLFPAICSPRLLENATDGFGGRPAPQCRRDRTTCVCVVSGDIREEKKDEDQTSRDFTRSDIVDAAIYSCFTAYSR